MLSELEAGLGYTFRDKSILENALTHSSYANENRERGLHDNERLEFLGDSILGFVVADYLYRSFPDKPEGELTRIRADLVCEKNLARAAATIRLGSFLLLGHGEEHGGGRKRDSIVSDAMESVIAASYMDGGFSAAKEIIDRLILCDVPAGKPHNFDYKTALQELVQRKKDQVLRYELIGESGPDHDKKFDVEVLLNGKPCGKGTGSSKKRAEQAAAEAADTGNEFTYAAVDPEREYGFVAVAAGEGLKAVFGDLGVDAVVSGGQTMNPSTEDILAAIQSVPAKTVFVLPNNKNIIMAAEQAQKLADRQVVVLPTRTVPMGITALLNFDPSVNAETNTINMMAAADKVSTGLITYAARDSEYDGKRIRKGEIMALENGKIVSTSTDITKATYRLARNMCKKDSSFVTIISGCDVSDEDAEKVTEIVKAKCPNHVEVSHIRGGQPVYYYMISVE